MFKKLLAAVAGSAFLLAIPLAGAASADPGPTAPRAAAAPVFAHNVRFEVEHTIFWDRNWPTPNEKGSAKHSDNTVIMGKPNPGNVSDTKEVYIKDYTKSSNSGNPDAAYVGTDLIFSDMAGTGGKIKVDLSNYLGSKNCGPCPFFNTQKTYSVKPNKMVWWTFTQYDENGDWATTTVRVWNDTWQIN